MEHFLCVFLVLISTSAAKAIGQLGFEQNHRPTVDLSLLSSPSSNRSIENVNTTLDVSALYTICYGTEEGSALVPEHCVDALVNGEFASLPPTELLEFSPRDSSQPAGFIGLPRRYLSCM